MRAILFGAVVGAVVGAVAAGVIYVARTADRPPAAPTRSAPPPPRPAPKAAAPTSPAPSPAPKADRPTFEADWKAAGAIVAKRRAGWRERAEKDMRALTADERDEAIGVTADAMTHPARMADEAAPTMLKMGLGDAVRSISSGWAIADPGFKAVSRAVWVPGEGPEAIADRAERWGQLNEAERADVARAVGEGGATADLPEDIRDAVLKAGLRRWLTR